MENQSLQSFRTIWVPGRAAAAAGVLGVELEKAGCYRLGAGARPPEPRDIGRAVRLLGTVVGFSVGAAFAVAYSPRLLGW